MSSTCPLNSSTCSFSFLWAGLFLSFKHKVAYLLSLSWLQMEELKLFNIPVFWEISSMNFPSLAILLPCVVACLAHRFLCPGGDWGTPVVSYQAACCPQGKGESCEIKRGVGASTLVEKCRLLKYSKPEVSCLENRYDVSNDADCFPLELPTA